MSKSKKESVEVEQAKKSKDVSLQDKLKESTAKIEKRKKERFIWVKAWVSYILTMVMKDRGKIPDNIGDKILITSNMYITKLYMSSIIQINELGENTPETLIGVLNKSLRERGNSCVLDFTFKNQPYTVDFKDSGLNSRIKTWNNIVNNAGGMWNPNSNSVRRAKRCLYTTEVAKAGTPLKQCRMYMTIRAKNLQELNGAEKILFNQLATMGCMYLPSYNTIKENLEYMSLIGNYKGEVKEKTPVIMSNQVMSQILPNCASYNDTEGYYLGQNLRNGSPFYLNTSKITVARNMYIVAPSGVGKTYFVLNLAQSAYEEGSAVCAMDIKGNEMTAFIKAVGGYIISLRPNAVEYINSWVMHKDDCTDANAENYFKERINFSKQQMIILSGIVDKEELIDFEEMLDEFHMYLYTGCGCLASNRNSWRTTEHLNPYVVFEKFSMWLTPEKASQYNTKKSLLGTLKMYMSASGSKSYIFKREFDYANILKSDAISFDFGILQNDGAQNEIDEDLFRLKFLYMSSLNGQFVTRKYAEGKRTLKILEESQAVSPTIMSMYAREYTLRRSQNQDTILLGNSVQALSNNVLAQPIIENTTGLFVGQLTKDARETLMEQFGIWELEEMIKLPGSKNELKNSFFFINNMQDKKNYPVLKVVTNPEIGTTKPKYKITVPVKESNNMSGT